MNEPAATQSPVRRFGKSAAAFRTISEVANELDVPSHVLRFWETKFNQVRPLKRGGGRRYYRPEDVDLLRRIRSLLYDDGYTIKGVQKLLRETAAAGPSDDDETEASARTVAPANGGGLDVPTRDALAEVLAELEQLRALLQGERR